MSDDWTVVDVDTGNRREFDSRSEAEEVADEVRDLGAGEVLIESPNDNRTGPETDGGAEVKTADTEAQEGTVVGVDDGDSSNIPLVEDPIAWLRDKNEEYVNTIKGTPAISKRGFRYLQSEYGISTESELVHTFDDPVGVVIWAKATLPDGRSAEAHGEGYVGESDVDDNEFVRYADSRAKSRALADLTASGALATAELQGGE